MNYIEAIIIGVVEGITEFLPRSYDRDFEFLRVYLESPISAKI